MHHFKWSIFINLDPKLPAGRKSTLVFCVNLAHVRELTSTFRAAGVDARYVYAGTPAAERTALVSAFKAGAYPVLLNCGMLFSANIAIYTSNVPRFL